MKEEKDYSREQVLDFIMRRWVNADKWMEGNCYWFAKILETRFYGHIYYLPVQGHFVTLINNHFYDWTGEVRFEEEPIDLSWIKINDPLWYERLVRDCIN